MPHDPVGTIAKWTYGLGSAAALGLLAQIVGVEHAHNAVPPRPAPVTAPDLPAEG
ncbi:hypothetical protein ACH4UT_23555 [Streptomyces sp. NPDC020799]|uniref:hypothetical protein n=1 Tax=Streptomyces sp. NPDC020799 TaxID=3365091 RepID=UPI0037A6DE0A